MKNFTTAFIIALAIFLLSGNFIQAATTTKKSERKEARERTTAGAEQRSSHAFASETAWPVANQSVTLVPAAEENAKPSLTKAVAKKDIKTAVKNILRGKETNHLPGTIQRAIIFGAVAVILNMIANILFYPLDVIFAVAAVVCAVIALVYLILFLLEL